MVIKLVHVLYAKLTAHFARDDILQEIEDIYSSLWCSQVLRNGNKCKTRVKDDMGVFCARHSLPKCNFILIKGKNKGQICGVNVHEGEFCKKHADQTFDEELARAKIVSEKKMCAGLCKNGAQCKRKAREGSDCCKVHENQEVRIEESFSTMGRLVLDPSLPIFAKEPVKEKWSTNLREQTGGSNEPEADEHDSEEAKCAEQERETSETDEQEELLVSVELSAQSSEEEKNVEDADSIISYNLKKLSTQPIDVSTQPIDVSTQPIDVASYCENSIVISGEFTPVPKQAEGCGVRYSSGRRAGQLCGKPIKQDGTCGVHKGLPVDESYNFEKYIPSYVWKRGGFWDALVKGYSWEEIARKIHTMGLSEVETLRDNDDIIDKNEESPKARHKICYYSDESMSPDPRYMQICGEKVSEGYFCKAHRRSEKTLFKKGCLDPRDGLGWVGRPLPTKSCGYFHFTRLNLFSWLTRRGLVVIGKLWHKGHAEQLTLCPVSANKSYAELPNDMLDSNIELDRLGGHPFMSEDESEKFKRRYKYNNNPVEGEDEASLILRCHNNGLLYKIIPQDLLLHQYDLTDIDNLPGKGFVSFEQMIRDRPKLYIKYWNVWNEQIKRAREWLKFEGKTAVEIYQETGIVDCIFWERFKETAFSYGLYNVIVPAPSLAQVCKSDFNPFKYCDGWVHANCPEAISKPHFPPMYILYPFPDETFEKKYKTQYETTLKTLAFINPQFFQHYAYSPKTQNAYTWLQWMKFGDGNSLFSGTIDTVPYSLRSRLGDAFPKRKKY